MVVSVCVGFGRYDKDGSGAIDVDELVEAMMSTGCVLLIE